MKIPFILILLSTLVHAQTAAYILCEGNFMVGNSTLWKISNQSEISGINENPIGDTGQSLTIDGNRLFSIMNGTGTIEVFDILESGDLDFVTSISTNFSGPREMVVLNGKGFVTEWYTNSIAILDLESLTFIGSIPVQGLPEDILTDGEQLFVSITMNSDWSNANTVVVIDPVSGLIINEFVVASGPGQMLLENDHLFISHIYYDDNWNTFAATSRINLSTGVIDINDYGQSSLFGSDIIFYEGNLFRIYDSGIVQLDENLSPIPETQIGSFPGLYSMDHHQNFIYLGLTNYVAPDEIKIIDFSGNEVASFSVGAIPGSFAFYNPLLNCEASGDTNNDGTLDILDLVKMIAHILGQTILSQDEVCQADSNYDGVLDVSDIVFWVNQIIA